VTADPPASTCGRREAGRLVESSSCGCVFLLVLPDEDDDDEEEEDCAAI
jgi:hypothetical protein